MVHVLSLPKRQWVKHQPGAKRPGAKRLEGDRTSGGNALGRNDSDSRRQDRHMFYPLDSKCVRIVVNR